MTTLAELYTQLERHDWYYSFSDDHRCWKNGEAERKRLDELAATIPGGPELKSAFSEHYFTGEPWGNEKKPLPPRPLDPFEIRVVNKRDGIPGEYVGRPSVLGNPFKIGPDGDRDEVVAKYRRWLWKAMGEDDNVLNEIDRLAEKVILDKGLTLVCWCAPQKCHADVIASAIEWRNSP